MADWSLERLPPDPARPSQCTSLLSHPIWAIPCSSRGRCTPIVSVGRNGGRPEGRAPPQRPAKQAYQAQYGVQLPTSSTRTESRRARACDGQLARAEFGVGNWLDHQGRVESARPHFIRAGQLAPRDFTIRRGTMPMQGLDSGGPEFFKMVQDWRATGNGYYLPLPDTASDSVPRW
jgi:hypothetical protein